MSRRRVRVGPRGGAEKLAGRNACTSAARTVEDEARTIATTQATAMGSVSECLLVGKCTACCRVGTKRKKELVHVQQVIQSMLVDIAPEEPGAGTAEPIHGCRIPGWGVTKPAPTSSVHRRNSPKQGMRGPTHMFSRVRLYGKRLSMNCAAGKTCFGMSSAT